MSLVTNALTLDQARDLTDEVKADAAALWSKLLTLYEGKAHEALGYTSWADYYEEEFGGHTRRGYQLLEAARVDRVLSEKSFTERPVNESVAREMSPVLKDEGPEAVEEVWGEVVEQHGPTPTAAEVRDVIQNREESPLETTPTSRRDQLRANAHKRRIVETVSYLRGLATGLGTLDVQRAVTAMEPGEAVEWAKELDRAITQLRSLRRDLETHA